MILGGSPLASIPVDGSDDETDEIFLTATPSPAPPAMVLTPHVISVIG